MISPLQQDRFLRGKIILHRRRSGEIEELDSDNCRVHIAQIAENAIQIAFYPIDFTGRFVIRIIGWPKIKMTGVEEM